MIALATDPEEQSTPESEYDAEKFIDHTLRDYLESTESYPEETHSPYIPVVYEAPKA